MEGDTYTAQRVREVHDVSYERPQNNDAPHGNWSGGQEGRTGGDPNATGHAGSQQDGSPKGNVYDPSSEPPQYGVRVPASQRDGGSAAGSPGYGQSAPQGQDYGYGNGNTVQDYGQQRNEQSWNPQQPWAGNQSTGQPGQSYGYGNTGQEYGGQNYGGQNYYAPPGGPANNQNPYDQPYVAPPVTPGRGWAITAVVLGAISLVLFFLGITVILAVLGLIFAIVALVKARKVKGSRKGLGITGLILSIIGLILSGIALAVWIVVGGATLQILNDPAGQECISQFMEDQDQAAYQQCLENVVDQQFNS